MIRPQSREATYTIRWTYYYTANIYPKAKGHYQIFIYMNRRITIVTMARRMDDLLLRLFLTRGVS